MLAVLAYHVGLPFFGGGYVGVDVFFVISGFLITNHLLAAFSATGRIGFARFYARRARRLLPAALTVLAITATIAGFFLPSVLFRGLVDDLVAATLYMPNLLLAVQGADYLSETAPSPVQHFWSLGVEEQFYLVWPLLLAVIVVLARRNKRRLFVIVSVGVTASLVAAVPLTFINQPWAFFSPVTRAWELGAGALVAIGWASKHVLGPRTAAVVAWLGVVKVGTAVLLFTDATPFPGFAAILPVLGTVLVLIAAPAAPVWGPTFLLRRRPVQFIGRISYALYLVHWPLLILPPLVDPSGTPLSLEQRIMLGALSVPIAWLLHRAVERPFLNTQWARALTPRAVLLGTATSMVVVLAITAGFARASSERPITSDQQADHVTPGVDPVEFSPVVPVGLRPSLSEASSDLPAVYADDCHLSSGEDAPADCLYGPSSAAIEIVLFGDSHAAQWFPALERLSSSESWNIRPHTKSSCPAADVTIVTDGVADTGCDRWRDAVIREIEVSPPDLVIISGFAHYDEYGAPSVTASAWAAGLSSVVVRLKAVTEVAVITDTPRFLRSPAICLSATVDDTSQCERPRDLALDSVWAAVESSAASRAGAEVLDLNPFLCTDEVCGVIIGNVLMYRDEHHLSATMSSSLSPALLAAVERHLPGLFDTRRSAE